MIVSIYWQRVLFLLTTATALLTAIASITGILSREIYLDFVSEAFLPGMLSQDIVSLFSAAGLVGALWMIRRGSQKAWLVWTGLNGYLFYAYALYSFERVYNPLYLVYIAP